HRRDHDGVQLSRRPAARSARSARSDGRMSGNGATSAGASDAPLLRIRGLSVEFSTDRGPSRAVDGISVALARGATLGLVGESGCGKSATALAILRLLGHNARAAGEIWLDRCDLLSLPEREMRAVRGARAAMIFQEPMTSLNPVFTVGS